MELFLYVFVSPYYKIESWSHEMVMCHRKIVNHFHKILSCSHKIVSCSHKIVSCSHKIVSCYNDLLTHGNNFVSCGDYLLSHDNMIKKYNKIVLCPFQGPVEFTLLLLAFFQKHILSTPSICDI